MALRTAQSDLRRRAWWVVAAFAAGLAYGLFLLFAFDVGVQNLDAAELFERSDDARALLIGDLVFPFLYGLVFPIAAWRFGQALTGGRPPALIIIAVVAATVGAVLDLAENILLLVAIANESAGLVDAAHIVAFPKLIGVVGNLLAVVILIQAVISLRSKAVAT